MKIRTCAALLIAVLTIPALTGCAAGTAQRSMETAATAARRSLDAVEDTIESVVTPRTADPSHATETTAPARAATEETTSHARTATAETSAAAGENSAKLTAEEAEQIALKHAGLAADQVTRLHSEYELEHGVPHYEVEFHHDAWEYNYEIHANTGEILSFEKDE